MSDTLASMRAEVRRKMRGDLLSSDDDPTINDALNDAIESIWLAMMPFALQRFLGLDSPVTFTVPSGAERVQLVTIADPTVAPTLQQTAGGQQAQRTILVGYTYVTESGSETQLSPTATLLVNANQLGQIQPPAALQNALGWNAYVSVSDNPGLMALENQQPLPFNAIYQEPVTGWQDYPADQQMPPQVQGATQATPSLAPPPSENSTGDNISWIKHLEVRNSDGALRSWNQFEIDSQVMRRYASTIASASEYQSYAWDLINGNRLEIRPATGLAFTPRYFYVAKPRRLRYDQAEIPYVSISGVHKFLIRQAVADLKLDLDEYLANQGFQAQADKEEMKILKSLRVEDFNRNARVAPHLS